MKGTRTAGLTIVECLLAMTILSTVFLAVIYTVVAGHQHVYAGDQNLRAVRLGKDLLEEIIGRPYRDPAAAGDGSVDDGTRSNFDVGDYHDYAEAPGQLADFAGSLYRPEEQVYGRSVSIVAVDEWIGDLERSVNGLMVTVTVHGPRGEQWRFSRFIPEPGD